VTEPGLARHLARARRLPCRSPQEHPDVVPGAHLVQELAEHLEVGRGGLAGVGDPDDLDLGHLREGPTLDPARDDRAAPVIEKTSSIAIRKGLSTSRTGSGM
jgi:hypothetical protein